MYSTPFDASLRNLFAFDLSLVSRRAIDRSSGNIATVSPAKPTALIASRPVKSGAPLVVSVVCAGDDWAPSDCQARILIAAARRSATEKLYFMVCKRRAA